MHLFLTNHVDVVSLIISVIAIVWGRKAPTATYSFGYHRAEILGALMSIFMIWVMALFLLLEAIDRLKNPTEVDSRVMLIVAGLGVLINIILGFVLYDGHAHDHSGDHSHRLDDVEQHQGQHRHENLNVRAAFVHVLGDLMQSLGVLLAAAIIWWRPEWHIIDPICTFLFTIIVVGTTGYLVRDTMRVLMEAVPKGMDLDALRVDLEKTAGVRAVEDLHVWSIVPGKYAATCHLLADKESDPLGAVEAILAQRYGILHTTVQVKQAVQRL